MRVDYIRVPGKEWVADPYDRFTTIDMRGPLISLVQRVFNAVMDDLPKGFSLEEDSVQASSRGLPGRALREAIVNALMHRSYRLHQPVLNRFSTYNLNVQQQQALIFLREVGAVDNLAYRQLSGTDTLRASSELRKMKSQGLLESKGKGRATYYIPGENFLRLMTQAPGLMTPPPGLMTPVEAYPQQRLDKIKNLGKRTANRKELETIVLEVCAVNPQTLSQLARLLNREEKYLLRHFLQPLRKSGKLTYSIPEVPNHPNQAYKTTDL